MARLAVSAPGLCAVALIGVFGLGPVPAQAQAKPCTGRPPGTALPGIALKEAVGGLREPVDIASPRDGSRRLFIVEQAGVVLSVREGALRLAPHFYNTAEEIDPVLEILEAEA